MPRGLRVERRRRSRPLHSRWENGVLDGVEELSWISIRYTGYARGNTHRLKRQGRLPISEILY